MFGCLRTVYQICKSDGAILSDKNIVNFTRVSIKTRFHKTLLPYQRTQKYCCKVYFSMKKNNCPKKKKKGICSVSAL